MEGYVNMEGYSRERLLEELELRDELIAQLTKELERYKAQNHSRKNAVSTFPNLNIYSLFCYQVSSEPDVVVQRTTYAKSQRWEVVLISLFTNDVFTHSFLVNLF